MAGFEYYVVKDFEAFDGKHRLIADDKIYYDKDDYMDRYAQQSDRIENV